MPAPIIPVLGIALEALKHIFPNPEERRKHELELIKANQEGSLDEINAQLSAIIMEAKSNDPWTSRARPSFLYVVYLYILSAVPFGFLFAYDPQIAEAVTTGVKNWLLAIPEPMWWLFGTGYLGYTGARTLDKKSILSVKNGSGKIMNPITNMFKN